MRLRSPRGGSARPISPGNGFVDLAVSAAGLLLLAPLFLLIAAAVRLDSPGPAFFLHERVGMGGKPLRVWKFRTMARNARELAERFTPAQRREDRAAL